MFGLASFFANRLTRTMLRLMYTYRPTLTEIGKILQMPTTTFIKNAAICFLSVAMLAACGGGDSPNGNTYGGAKPPVDISAACPASHGGVATSAPVYHGTATVAVCSNVFVDPLFTANQQVVILTNIKAAIATNKTFYGTLQTEIPDIVACYSAACATYFTGSTTINAAIYPTTRAGEYVAPHMTVVITSPYWGLINSEILAHELSHVELYQRTGGAFVAAWFNEGLATYIGKQFECAGVAKGIDDLSKLDLQLDWNTYTGASGVVAQATYCQASAEVSAWISQKGSSAAITQLLESLRLGQNFYTLYGPLSK